MNHVLVVCGAGASSTFLVHAMRREIDGRGLSLTVDATTLDGVASRARGVSLVLVAHHLAAAADSIRDSLPPSVRIAVLDAISPTGDGPSRALDLAVRVLAQPVPSGVTATPV